MSMSPTDEEFQDEQAGSPEQDSAQVEAIADAVEQACADDATGGDQPADLEAELINEKDRVLRLQAEMENLRSRTAREVNEERRYAPMAIIRDLLPVIDNMDRAIEAAQQHNEAATLLEGFQLVRQQLLTVLEQHHCQPIEAVGQPFDPQIHEAILQQPSDEQPANHVLLETQVGYQLHDRVVRASQVIISTGPAEG
ncbi:MAG: nucleotide exchange factor GrpE [Bythopirellula sp.]